MLLNDYCNFQKSLLTSPKCKGCDKECVVLYDAHHDQYFSVTCGVVIMEMGVFCLDYFVDYDKVFKEYESRFAEQRRLRKIDEMKRR